MRAAHEFSAAPHHPRNGPLQFQSDRGRQRAADLAVGRQQARQGFRGRARRRAVRASRQAAARSDGGRQGSHRDRRAHADRCAEPDADRRAALIGGRRHAADRHHAHASALHAAAHHRALQAGIPARAPGAQSGKPARHRRDPARGRNRHRPRHRHHGEHGGPRDLPLLYVGARGHRPCRASPRARCATDARSRRRMADHHLRRRADGTHAHRRRVRARGHRAGHRHLGPRCRRDQILRRARSRRRHHRSDGFRLRARHKVARASTSSRLFDSNTSSLGIRRGRYLRGYVYRFIELCSPALTEAVVRKTL